MYPITTFPMWATIIGALALMGVGYWVADRDNSGRPLGQAALPIVLISGWTWFTTLPEWTAWLALIATVVLFVAGMFRDSPMWHYGAMAVALVGKLIMWALPWLWRALTGQVTIPTWVLLLLIILAVLGIAAWRSDKVRHGLERAVNRTRPEATT